MPSKRSAVELKCNVLDANWEDVVERFLFKVVTDTVGEGDGRFPSPTALNGDFAVDTSEAPPVRKSGEVQYTGGCF